MTDQIRKYERWVIEFFGKKPLEAFEETPCPFGCAGVDSVRCFYRGAGLDIKRCVCGMVWNASQPTQATLDEFYAKSKAMDEWSKHKASEQEQQRQNEKFSPAIEHIIQAGVKSVLDFGAGNGVFLKLLKEAKPEIAAWGVDPSPAAIEEAKRNGVDVKNTGLVELTAKNAQFDLASMWGVLEHLKEPLDTLKQLAVLADQVLVCVPNVESTVVKALGKRAFTFCPQHLWYFSKKTVELALRRAGFVPRVYYTIEDELAPIQKHRRLFDDPYRKDIPEWAWKDEKLEQPIEGYKILMIAEKNGSQRRHCADPGTPERGQLKSSDC